MRLDKYVWCIRLIKTRSLAAKICSAQHIRLNGEVAKPSKSVFLGDIVSMRDHGEWREFKVLDFPKSRVGAKLVPTYMNEITAEEVLEKIRLTQLMNKENRAMGFIGRPTKKSRRDLKRFTGK